MQREPFERWLAESTRRGGSDDEPGTVLVGRSSDHLVQHAAVAIGDGWVLHKPSQGWMSPIKILTADQAKVSARAAGRRLLRYTTTRPNQNNRLLKTNKPAAANLVIQRIPHHGRESAN